MTKKNNFTTKTKSILILALTLLLAFVTVLCTACAKDNKTTSSDKEYSKIENDTSIIKNGSFEYGTYALDYDDYPKNSSISGWSSVSTDNSADSSDVSSGIVYTADEAWAEYLDKLCKDNDYIAYAKIKYASELGDNPSDDDVKTKIKESLESPKTHETDKDGKVLMINNYVKEYYEAPVGTAQKATSSTTVTVKKGEYGIVTFWVKTLDLVNQAGANANKGGANVRLINTINGSSQADYGIYGINTDGETANNCWKQYSIYLKGDTNFDTTFQVVVGLGLGNGGVKESADYTQGTAFFDDIVYKTVSESDYTTNLANEEKLIYSSDDDILVDVGSDTVFAYDMTLNEFKQNDTTNLFLSNYFTSYTVNSTNVSGEYTKSQDGQYRGYFDGVSSADLSYTDNNQSIVLGIEYASYTLDIVDNANFVVDAESYFYLSFKVKTDFDRFDKNSLNFYIVDNDGEIVSDNNYVVAFSDEEQEVGLMFKNGLTTANETRSFSIKIVVGRTDVTNPIKEDYSNGTLTISDIKYAKGSTNQYVKNSDPNAEKVETDYYKLYSLYSGIANKTITLDSATDDSASNSYTFSPAPSSYGTSKSITKGVANVSNYHGVTPQSTFIKENGTDSNTDTNEFAGVINTKYIKQSDYNADVSSKIGAALDEYTTDDDKYIQPLMIYQDGTSYGFIGKALTVSASQFAKISVKVKVVGDATAYFYLVDAYGKDKNVLTLDDFTENTTDGHNNEVGKTFSNNQMVLSATKDDMGDDGWATLTFYVATGNTEKKFRVEMWNGARDAASATAGVVFFDEVKTVTSSGFTEYTDRIEDAFTTEGSIFNGLDESHFNGQLGMYRRELGDEEIEYNSENPDNEVSYDAKYIWAKTDDFVFASFNTLDPTPFVAPADDTSDNGGAGCTAQTDPATFWLSFSSIIIGAALLFAIIMLFVKNIRRRRKANASDAKSHYKVTSRVANKKQDKKRKNKPEVEETKVTAEDETEPVEEVSDEEKTDETLDEYVYGEVEDFGEAEAPKDSDDNN